MNTRFVSVNPPLTQHPGVARAEEVGSYFSVLGSQLSAALAQGWQAMCRRRRNYWRKWRKTAVFPCMRERSVVK